MGNGCRIECLNAKFFLIIKNTDQKPLNNDLTR